MLNVLQNQQFTFEPSVEARDSGWTVSGNKASHLPCNPGTMRSIGSLGIQVGRTYVITYIVPDWVSGTVKVLLGTTSGTSRSAAGTYTETLLCAGSALISFFSDGELSISDLSFYVEEEEAVDNAVTMVFFEGEGQDKKWLGYRNQSPDLMIKFINKFFMVKDGAIWQMNANGTHNNFFGVQYKSQITFYDNINPIQQKLYFSIRCEANTPWYCPATGDIMILPVVGRSMGMQSRLKKNNFRNYQGSWFADFMRNALDSRFNTQDIALYKGEPLRGRVMQITVTNADVSEAILFEIDVKSSVSMLTY